MFPLDEKYVETPLEAGGYTVWHRLERPTKAQQIVRDQRIKSEEITHGERIETIYDDDYANIETWNECARAIKGYDLGNGASPHEWVELTDELRSLMPSEHKMKAAAALFYAKGVIDKASQNGGGFRLLGATEISIKLELGNEDAPQYTHVLRRPSESEWGAYHRSALKVYQVRGAKQPRWISNPNLTAAITLYDALLTRLEGVSLAGGEYDPDKREAFIQSVDPSHKRAVVRAFADYWSADLANLGTRS